MHFVSHAPYSLHYGQPFHRVELSIYPLALLQSPDVGDIGSTVCHKDKRWNRARITAVLSQSKVRMGLVWLGHYVDYCLGINLK